jgi:hypothetical protein
MPVESDEITSVTTLFKVAASAVSPAHDTQLGLSESLDAVSTQSKNHFVKRTRFSTSISTTSRDFPFVLDTELLRGLREAIVK